MQRGADDVTESEASKLQHRLAAHARGAASVRVHVAEVGADRSALATSAAPQPQLGSGKPGLRRPCVEERAYAHAANPQAHV